MKQFCKENYFQSTLISPENSQSGREGGKVIFTHTYNLPGVYPFSRIYWGMCGPQQERKSGRREAGNRRSQAAARQPRVTDGEG